MNLMQDQLYSSRNRTYFMMPSMLQEHVKRCLFLKNPGTRNLHVDACFERKIGCRLRGKSNKLLCSTMTQSSPNLTEVRHVPFT
ncbi:hypothetical protein CDAR_242301 [Caerostris darwini]|uniref:Uncharacterized protein n=1 Tax=Caerostris darwini TaxID=1538125 RepID=A0AAV4RWW3_9ARAC|nr:hypothetical protein CDAR_242301 [Caerostris darwini]